MEAYVDDMIVKSIEVTDHVDDLEKAFDVL